MKPVRTTASRTAVGGTALSEQAMLRERLRGLDGRQAQQLRQVMRDIARNDFLMAGQNLLALALSAPDHPEVLRWRGARHMALGEWADAAACLSRSAELGTADFALLIPLAQAHELTGAYVSALHALQAAASCASNAAKWLALSVECDRQGHFELALAAVEQAIEHDPRAPVPLLQRARCRLALGMAERAAADCRTLIAAGQLVSQAWFTLIDMKTVRLLPGELEQLEQAAQWAESPPTPQSAQLARSPQSTQLAPSTNTDRQLLSFALGKALEDARQFEAALAAFHRANAAVRSAHPWDSAAFARRVQAVHDAFADGPTCTAREQGAEVIFLVGLPRSGTTLVEQVLASHSRVEGASELPYLNMVVEEESRRRGREFPAWVATATADDWTRLGQRYLQLSARWRHDRPVATDKLPENWLLAGAAMAMLPQARVIDCRRDAFETCWSCYKQLFGPQRVGFTYAFDTLASYWHDYDKLCQFWADRYSRQFHVQSYEALVAEPESQIHALLAFCNLPFEPGCLQFHTAQRAIRTPSASQVRQPMTTVSAPGAGYGALLDPLRRLLGPSAGYPGGTHVQMDT